MKCPICDFEGKDDGIRCPSCQTALTLWINYDAWAETAYAGALQALKDGDREGAVELLLRASISSPENPRYLAAYGRVLAHCGRYQEAAQILEKAHQANPSEANHVALERAKSLAQAPPPASETRPAEAPSIGDACLPAQGPLPVADDDGSEDQRPDSEARSDE